MNYIIDEYTFRIAKPIPTTNVKFFSQNQLRELATPEANAELYRRAVIIANKETYETHNEAHHG